MHLDDLAHADLAIFFSPDETHAATWITDGGAVTSMAVLFDETYEAVDPETEAVVMSTQPRIGCRSDELPAEGDAGDILVVRGERFTVVEIQPEGLTTKVYLHREVA